MTEAIMKKLDDSFRFGLVNGDNFYPTKTEILGKKHKNYDDMDQKIEKGFSILRKNFTRKIFISLGNHEVDNPGPCLTLLSEIEKSRGSNLIIPTNYYSLNIFNKKGDKLKLFVLDVNLLEDNLCYDDKSREEHKLNMMQWLSTHIEKIKSSANVTEYVYAVMGHYPLFYFDKKGNFVVNQTTIQILRLLKSMSPLKIYYFASDVHNYQYIKHENIHQFIVGTGGAKLDNMPEILQSSEFTRMDVANEEGDFTIMGAKKMYGSLILTLEKGTLNHTFDPLEDGMQGGNFTDKFFKYSVKNEEIINEIIKKLKTRKIDF
jgi:hypothetical protein